METVHYSLTALAVLLLIISLLPLIRSDYWTFRIFDFPRLQKLTLSALTAVVMLCFPSESLYYNAAVILLGINCIYLATLVYPYTPFARRRVKSVVSVKEENCISMLVANVYQENTDHQGCMRVLSMADADVILLLETDRAWEKGVSRLQEQYPHQVLVPLENTYGMLFFSKLPLRDAQVKFLVEAEIPSIHCQVQLRNKQWVQLYCLHPTPPSPTENVRSTERDKELLLVAEAALAQQLPVLVLGDLNDVAWSYTTELFLKMSGLLDPRHGRGFFNSFNANYRLLRFPLDHLFVSNHFKLVNLRRLDNFNSDHFPIYGKYQFEPGAPLEQETLQPDAADIAIAEEKKEAV